MSKTSNSRSYSGGGEGRSRACEVNAVMYSKWLRRQGVNRG
mgnify:CR=1 FL=1